MTIGSQRDERNIKVDHTLSEEFEFLLFCRCSSGRWSSGLMVINPQCMRERVIIVVCQSVIQHGISKTANFYPLKWTLS